MTGVRVWRMARDVSHWLHAAAIVVAVVLLLDISFHGTEGTGFGVNFELNVDEFSFLHHGIYGLIIVALVAGGMGIRWSRYRHRNTMLPREVASDPNKPAACPGLEGEFFSAAGTGEQLSIERVSAETFDEFLGMIEDAYPAGLVSSMSKEQRRRTYGNWLKSERGFVAFVVRKAGDKPARRIGFVAACEVKSSKFEEWITGDTAGIEYPAGDLGADKAEVSFVDIKHWYIRQGTAGREAMLWVMGKALRATVRPGAAPVLYSHTVSEAAENNHRALGFAYYGKTLVSGKPQYVLDGRRSAAELPAAAKWTLERLCDAESKALALPGQPYVRKGGGGAAAGAVGAAVGAIASSATEMLTQRGRRGDAKGAEKS